MSHKRLAVWLQAFEKSFILLYRDSENNQMIHGELVGDKTHKIECIVVIQGCILFMEENL